MTRIRIVEVVGNGEGGGTKCVARIVRHLDPQRFALTVVAPEAPWLAEECARVGAVYHPLPLLRSRFNAHMAAHLRDIIAESQATIVNGHGTRAAWFTLRALARTSQRPALVYSEHLFSFDAREGANRFPWMAIERYICRHMDALATSCGANAQLAETRGWIAPERIAMRHYGIELERFVEQAAHPATRQEIGIAPDVPLVGTVARLVPQKGMPFWLDAAALVARELPTAQFIIVGDGELRGELERQTQHLGLAERVHFLGAHDAPWRILAACDIVAFSSLFEGLPQAGLEALSAGMPSVMTRLNGTIEIVREGWNGLLVPVRSAPALAEGMLRLLRDPSLCASIRAVAPGSVTDYHTDVMIEHFRALYERLEVTRPGAAGTPQPTPVTHLP